MQGECIASAEGIVGQIITVEGGKHSCHPSVVLGRNPARLDNRDTSDNPSQVRVWEMTEDIAFFAILIE